MMPPPPLAPLHARLRSADLALLRALDARSRFPRHPLPAWTPSSPRLPPPPLPEILLALSPPGTAPSPSPAAPANLALLAALAARQHLACELADAKTLLHPDDFHAALAIGDRPRLADLLADLADELLALDFIRAAAPESAPALPPDLAPFLWREHLLPWARQTELDHLAAP